MPQGVCLCGVQGRAGWQGARRRRRSTRLPSHHAALARPLTTTRPARPPQKHTWSKGLTLRSFEAHAVQNERLVEELKDLSGAWVGWWVGGWLPCMWVGG